MDTAVPSRKLQKQNRHASIALRTYLPDDPNFSGQKAATFLGGAIVTNSSRSEFNTNNVFLVTVLTTVFLKCPERDLDVGHICW